MRAMSYSLAFAALVLGLVAGGARAQTPSGDLTPDQYEALAADGRSAHALAKAGRKLVGEGRYLQAEPLLEKRLWRCQADAAATTHEELGAAFIDLADLYALEGRYPDSEALYDRAYDLLRPDLGLEHPLVLELDDHRAELYRLQGRLLRSEELQRRVLDARERRLGVDAPEVAGSLDHLARLLRDEGRYGDATELLERALSIRGRGFGRWGAAYALTMRDLASVYAAQRRWTPAETSYRRALGIERRALGRRHPETTATAAELAWVLRQDGQPTEAAALERDVEAERAVMARDVPADASAGL